MRRLVQQEDYALALMQRAGLPSPEPYGVAELTPEREYLIVFAFIDGAKEIGEAEVDDAIIDQGLGVVRTLWDANLAHRDIKPANLLVRDGKLYLIDVFFAQLHPSPWRQSVDLANMLLCLALRSSPQRVYQRALQQFTVGEISEAFAAARGLALPSQLRKLMRDQGRDLAGEFVRLLPTPPRPIAIQRWSTRRVALLLLVLLVLIPAAVPMAWVFATASANPSVGAAVSGGNGSCTQLEELWLQAQSVPSASRIPCVQALPRRRLWRAGCPQRRVGAGTQPRQPRPLPHRRPMAPGSCRRRRRDDPAHRNLRPPHERGGADHRARRPALPDRRSPRRARGTRRVPRRLCHLPAGSRQRRLGWAAGAGPARGDLPDP